MEILYRDDDCIAVDKPPGMLVHRGPIAGDRCSVYQVLTAQLGERLFGVHRLDRAASGVLLFARSSAAAKALHDAVRAQSTVKEYLVAARDLTPESFTIDRPLAGRSGQALEARTECARIASIGRHSLLRVRIRSGRRHQIRRHLKHLAHNVLGDTTHGKGRINAYLREHYGLPRMFLHAWRLAFDHPVTGARVQVRAPLPDDLRSFLLRVPEFDPAVLEQL
jgi:tRNA pseudouridine65 synthase